MRNITPDSSQPARDAAEEVAKFLFEEYPDNDMSRDGATERVAAIISKHFPAAAAPVEQSEWINQLRSNGCDSTFPGCARAGIMRGAKWICANHAVSIRGLVAPVADTGDDEGEKPVPTDTIVIQTGEHSWKACFWYTSEADAKAAVDKLTGDQNGH